MKQLTIRNVSPVLARALERERSRRRKSLNQTVLDLLGQALGVEPESRFDNGLAKLAGTWSEEEHAEFEKNTAVFGHVDEEQWQ